MMRELRVHPDAKQETREALAYYKLEDPDLARRYFASVREAIDKARRDPMLYRPMEGEVRNVRVKGFPYTVIFRAREEEDLVEIYAVAHQHRRPGYWKERMEP